MRVPTELIIFEHVILLFINDFFDYSTISIFRRTVLIHNTTASTPIKMVARSIRAHRPSVKMVAGSVRAHRPSVKMVARSVKMVAGSVKVIRPGCERPRSVI